MSSSPMRLTQHGTYIDQASEMQTLLASMMFENTANSISGKAFWLALLLTRSTELAESVVAMAIQGLTGGDFSQSTLIAEVARTSWNRFRTINSSEQDVREACLLIPPELQRVLELPPNLRFCFCFRVLAGMSAQACGRLMSMRAEEADCLLRLAACTLAVDGQSSIPSSEQRSY